jgi:hypothetical protein
MIRVSTTTLHTAYDGDTKLGSLQVNADGGGVLKLASAAPIEQRLTPIEVVALKALLAGAPSETEDTSSPAPVAAE